MITFVLHADPVVMTESNMHQLRKILVRVFYFGLPQSLYGWGADMKSSQSISPSILQEFRQEMAPKDAAVQEGLKLCLQGQMQLFHQLVYLTIYCISSANTSFFNFICCIQTSDDTSAYRCKDKHTPSFGGFNWSERCKF